MNSREKILAAVKKNQPPLEALPILQDIQAIRFDDPWQKYQSVLEGIGGTFIVIDDLQKIGPYVKMHFTEGHKYISTIDGLNGIEKLHTEAKAHQLEDVEVAIISGAFAVAENSAIWTTTDDFSRRALPFICQHLVAVLHRPDIVHNMHEAYEKIGSDAYDFGVFIAGPSKTADIEQSLVLGAHGPKTMTVFLIG